MSITRWESPVNEVITDAHYMGRIEKMSEMFARSNLCPEAFRGKPNDVAIIAYTLADLGLRLTLNTLPQCYVVHGRPGLMAQLQAGLCARYGYDVRPKMSVCDEESATVQVVSPQGEIHEATFTMKEAERAGLTKPSKNGTPSMYKTWPANMLIARATTRAIKWYCPEVTLGLAGQGVELSGMDEVDAADGQDGISAITAKNKLVEAWMESYPKPRAVELAKQLWDAHGLGSDPISQAQLDEMIAEAKVPAESEEIVDAEVVEDGEPFE